MRIAIDISKTVEKNASDYFEKAKKSKKKIEGAKEALAKTKSKINKLKKSEPEKKSAEKKPAKKEWYEKFRWFISSEGFLCIGGRDATTNDIIIKKYAEENDIIFHTDIAGSPFFVVKTENKKPGKATIEEAAQATAIFSRAWKLGLASADVFSVKPEQVTKTTQSGEYIQKGAFMIYGKKSYIKAELNLAVGIHEGKIIAGPFSAVKSRAEKFAAVEQGSEKASDTAKQIQKKIGGELDDIIRALPAGGFRLKWS